MIPVIAKADTMTDDELAQFREEVSTAHHLETRVFCVWMFGYLLSKAVLIAAGAEPPHCARLSNLHQQQ